jgi:hypothetical protein
VIKTQGEKKKMEDVQFGFKSDYDSKESKLRRDPKTGAIYAAHGKEPDPPKHRVKFQDEYYDPYEEHGRRAIPFLRQEIADFERVSTERFQSDKFTSSAYSARNVGTGGEDIRISLLHEGHPKSDPTDDPFFCFSAPLRKLLRSHTYIMAITTILQPEISKLKWGFPQKITDEELKNMLSKKGAIFLKKDKDRDVFVFQFSEIYEDDITQPRLEEEFMNLNERTVTSFIESRMFLRVVLRRDEDASKYFIEKYFFTFS